MKTIIKAFLSIAMIATVAATAPMASAAYSINTMADDCMTVTIANHTTGAGVADPCWTNTTINAKVGDIINVAIYYDNSGTTAAPNVSFKLTDPQNRTIASNGSVSMTGSILVNGSVVKSGTVTLNVTGGPSELIFGSLVKYEHATGVNAPVSGAGIFTSGYVLGNMNPGESGQGVIKANFLVADDSSNGGGGSDTGLAPNVTTSNYSGYNSELGNVTLNGTFDSNGYSTTTSFMYRRVGDGSWITAGSTNRGTGSGAFSYPLTGLAAGTYEYKAHASNAYGSVDGSIFTFTISGNNTTSCPSGYYWNGNVCIQNVTSCPSGYYLSGNTCIQNIISCPSGYYLSGNTCIQNIVNNNSLPSVSTLGTISIGGTAVAVDGYYTANGCNVYTSFRYGTTQSLGYTTEEVSRGNGTGSMAQSLSGLSQNTTYYYQAQARNCVGTMTGSIRSFTTGSNTVNDTTIIRTITNISNTANNGGTGGGNSFIKLMIDNHREIIRGGNEIAYEVSWENITNRELKKLVLEVNFPTQMSVLDADHGLIERNKNSVIYQIDTLEAREKGTMIITTSVTGNLRENDPVVAQAIMAFENPKTSAAENAIAYDADQYSALTGSVLGASLFGLDFLPHSLGGWLLILLILLIIIILAHAYITRYRASHGVVVNTAAPVHTPVVETVTTPGADYVVYRPTPKQ